MARDVRASLIAQRLRAQLLTGTPARHPAAVAGHLLAVQAQDARAARLAVRARSRGVTVADFDHALSQERSMLISWLNRGTLHLVRSEDYGWLHSLTTPQLLTGCIRRLHQEGVTLAGAEKAATTIERALQDDGPLTRRQLRDRIASTGVRTTGQALVHLLMFATIRGVTIRGPMVRNEHAFALVRDWIGAPEAVPRDHALGELARRYLASHAPASEHDLAWWAGLPLRDARAGLQRIGTRLLRRADGLLQLADKRRAAGLGAPRLLGAFEPLLLGWRSREEVLGDFAPEIVQGGMFRPMILSDGRAAGTWRLRAGEVQLEPFRELSAGEESALSEDAAAMLRYLT